MKNRDWTNKNDGLICILRWYNQLHPTWVHPKNDGHPQTSRHFNRTKRERFDTAWISGVHYFRLPT
jgi:hypothetical protein